MAKNLDELNEAQNLERWVAVVEELDGRHRERHEKITGPRGRLAHFHNLPSADPMLPEPFNLGQKWQWDGLRRFWKDLKARLAENSYQFEVTDPGDTEAGRGNADDLKITLQNGFENVEKRHQFSLQGDLADGLIVQDFGVLHWNRNDRVLPDPPEYQELDDLAELGTQDKKRFTQDDYGDGKPKGKKYRETDASLQDRIARGQALAGFPYDLEVIPSQSITFQQDRGVKNGFARVKVRREFGVMDYASRLKTDAMSEDEATDGEEPIKQEVEAPADWMPSGTDWRKKIIVHQIWDCEKFVELTDDGNGSLRVMRSFLHDWKMPPFAIAEAMHFNSPDPVLAYEPALEGIYRTKPMLDYAASLVMSGAESVALPYFYFAKIDPSAPDIDESGQSMFFSKDAAQAMKTPDGYKIEQLVVRFGPEMIEMVRDRKLDAIEAAPSTGKAQFDANTKPWAAKLEQSQESVEPSRYMFSMARCLQICGASIAEDMSAKDEPTYVFGRSSNGNLDMSTVVGVEPKAITSLAIDVAISNVSSAEKITLMQVGTELLKDEIITLEDWWRDYAMDEDPQKRVADLLAWKAFEQYVMPGLVKQLLAEAFGNDIVLGPDGAAIGPQGQQMTPQQVLQQNGTPSLAPPQTQAPQPNQPNMPSLTPAPSMNGSMAQPGMAPV